MRQLLLYSILCILLFSSCKEKTYIYEVNDILVTPNNAEKDKQKTTEQYLSILYANLYQKALSPNQLVNLSDIIASIGDKQVAYETVVAKMMSDSEVRALLPTAEEMRNDIELFIKNTYQRFFVRFPTEAEKTYWVNYIESHPNITPEHIYFAFATCDEYYFY